MSSPEPVRVLGRYALHGVLAAGGMAAVHVGRVIGGGGFTRTVAIKRLHPQFARDADFASMFLDEARIVARIRHPNVVPTLDVVATDGELFIVMEYVQGDSLSKLLRAASRQNAHVPPRIASGILSGVLFGLHAAHEAKDELGTPLSIVHRDVTPQNVLIGVDGVARILDFGVAKAVGRLHTTREGQLKGKIPYMPPEQIRARAVDRRTDVYAASVVLWETLTGQRLFDAPDEVAVMAKVLEERPRPPSEVAPWVPATIDRVVMRGLDRDPAKRYATAREMAVDLENVMPPASAREIGEWVESLASDSLAKRLALVEAVEREHASGRGDARESLSSLHSDPTGGGLRTPSAMIAPPTTEAATLPSPSRGLVAPPPVIAPAVGPSVGETADSKITEFSSASTPRAASPISKPWVLGTGAALLAVAAIVAVAIFRSGSDASSTREEPHVPAPAASLAAPSAPTPVATPAPMPSAAPPVASGAVEPVVSATAEPSAAPPPPTATSVPPPHPRADTAPKTPAKPDCKNPYAKGPDGFLRIRPECVR